MRRPQPEILAPVKSPEEQVWGYLNGTRDADRVIQIIQMVEQKSDGELAVIELKDICAGIASADSYALLTSLENHSAIIILNKKIKLEQLNIQDIVDSNILPYLLTFLSHADYPQLNVPTADPVRSLLVHLAHLRRVQVAHRESRQQRALRHPPQNHRQRQRENL